MTRYGPAPSGGDPTPDGGVDGPTDSLREYLGALEATGELNRIDTNVSWNLEASAVAMVAPDSDSS